MISLLERKQLCVQSVQPCRRGKASGLTQRPQPTRRLARAAEAGVSQRPRWALTGPQGYISPRLYILDPSPTERVFTTWTFSFTYLGPTTCMLCFSPLICFDDPSLHYPLLACKHPEFIFLAWLSELRLRSRRLFVLIPPYTQGRS